MSASGWFRLMPVTGKQKCVSAQNRESRLSRKIVPLATLLNISQLIVSPFVFSVVWQRHIKAGWILFTPETFSYKWETHGRAVVVVNESLCVALCLLSPIPAKVELGRWQRNPSRAFCFFLRAPFRGRGHWWLPWLPQLGNTCYLQTRWKRCIYVNIKKCSLWSPGQSIF